jgi:hypothetical protein
MLNTVDPLTAFQLEVCGNRYTPQNVVVIIPFAGDMDFFSLRGVHA